MSNADKAFERGNQFAAQENWQQAIHAFDQCIAANPQDWQALSNRANACLKLGNNVQALDDYLAAATLNPQSISIKCNLAVLLKELGELALAESMLREVLQAEPKHVDAWSNLGVVCQHQLQYQEAIRCHLQALELAGPSAARYNNLGNACTSALLLDDAIAILQGGLELEPEHANLRFSLSIALLLAGRYRDAWPYYEARWDTILTARHQQKRWQGESLASRRLLLWAEQGLGDSLQMVRFLPLLQTSHPDAKIMLACPATFHRLFQQFAGIELLSLEQTTDFDYQLPIMSLPGVLDITLENLPLSPYLQASNTITPIAPRSERLQVGVVWESGYWGVGKADYWRQHKSIPPDLFAELCQVANIDFISLQPSATPAPLQALLHHPELSDFADTAAWIAAMDLVISVDTAVAHLAGAMGKPVWILMRAESAPFFMASGETAPWYPSAHVWRQQQAGDWLPVLEDVKQALSRLQKQVLSSGKTS
ncbi:tetratricopeptide repeat-containing glycosyltransferase family protein [Neisseriaceae bacterium TC5R-5]|nr:tetratricopeptide repeat-containing glycosyltransferase family protein [Neisseriaceae bacterium TC5R-5]